MYFSLLVDFMKRIKMKKKRDDMIIDKIYEIDQIDKNTETSQILDLIFE